MSVRIEDYDDIVARINRKYEGSLQRGNEIEHVERIPTGSLELDAAMGGGIPQGRWSRFYGGYSSGKTIRALLTAKHAQDLGLTVAYYNMEKQYDPEFAERNIGLKTKELTVVQGATVEEIGEKAEALFGVVHLHIFDSCSIAVSEDELNADIRDWRPGITARAWGKVFRRLNERFDQRENTIMLIDQVRVNFKTGAEDPAGGKIFDHQASMTVSFKRGSWLWRNENGWLDDKAKQEKGPSGQAEPAGIEVKARIEKSRVCRPLRTATMRFDLDKLEFDNMFELVKAAKHYGLIEVRGTSHYYYNGERVGQSDKALREFLSDVEMAEKVKETVWMHQRR